MGNYGEAYVTVEVDSPEDAKTVNAMLDNIEELTRARTECEECHFRIDDRDTEEDDEEMYFVVKAPRRPNLYWQVEQIIAELKILVKEKKIAKVIRFDASVMISDDGFCLEEDDFLPNLKVV